MLGKRKRTTDEPTTHNLPEQESPTKEHREILPLTETNLKLLNSMRGSGSQPVARNDSAPESASEPGADKNTIVSTGLWSLSASQILDVHSFFIDRFQSYPADLKSLCESISQKVPGMPTPISEKIRSRWRITRNLSERNAQAILENMLGYQGEVEDETGEVGIFRDRERQWNKAAVPVKDNPGQEELIQAILDRAGIPTTPKPDTIYGYNDSSFTPVMRHTFTLLPQQALTTPDQPWFPYFIMEWKSTKTGGSLREAEVQARRDGATAINALYNVYRSLGIDPSAAQTAVFTACVDSDQVCIRVHWRNVAQDGSVTYEADVIAGALLYQTDKLFEVRGVIRHILDWAKGPRLINIRDAFEKGRSALVQSSTLRQSPKKKRAAALQDKGASSQRPPTPTLTASTSNESPVRDPKRPRVMAEE